MIHPAAQALADAGRPIYLVSPHYDDAVLSAGALATYLAPSNPIHVINVFTQPGPKPYSLSAKAYLKQCGYTDADTLYRDRTTEDKLALGTISQSITDLGFTDALWRLRPGALPKRLAQLLPELGVAYPTYRFHISKGQIAAHDRHTLEAIKLRLRELMPNPANTTIFCPLGIGGHIDHIITRMAVDAQFPNAIHWADYPYSIREGVAADPALTQGLRSFEFADNTTEKTALIKKYETQYEAMFSHGLSLRPEAFFYPQSS